MDSLYAYACADVLRAGLLAGVQVPNVEPIGQLSVETGRA
jgi:hypothetical protein